MVSNEILTYAHTPCNVPVVYSPSSGVYRPITSEDFNGAVKDFSGVLDTGIGAEYIIENNGAYSTIGFHVMSPSGLIINFFGSFDGTNYEAITFRNIGSDGYTQKDESDGTVDCYIGSIAALKRIKFSNQNGLTGARCVAGRMVSQLSVLEGIEHSAPPHKFGGDPFHRGIYLNNTTGSGILVYQPPTGFRFAITDISLSVFSAGANITLYEDGDVNNPNSWVFSAFVKATSNDSQVYNLNLSTPFLSSSANYGLYLAADATSTVRGVVHGYYVR